MRQFLQAGLADFTHLASGPATPGRGVPPREGSTGPEDHFTAEPVTSPSGLTRQLRNNNDHA